MIITFRRGLMLMLMAVMAANSGCSSLTGAKDKSKKDSGWSLFPKKEYQAPQSINVTWTYDIFTKEGKPPTRGFGGRLYFYNEKSQAIPVEGELMVYGFDDTERDHTGSGVESAEKKFRFTPEQFTTHFSESQLGASYSIWIPWDAAPGLQKKIMLIPTFKTKEGRVIRGNSATLLLPGVNTQESEQTVIQASARGPSQNASRSNVRSAPRVDAPPRTTTIQLPPRNYQAKPVLSPERAEQLLDQANREVSALQTPPLMINPTQGRTERVPMGSSESSVSTTTVPATQVATNLPGFHIPAGSISGNGSGNVWANGSGLPGFAQASIAGFPARSGSNSPPVPASSTSPANANQPR